MKNSKRFDIATKLLFVGIILTFSSTLLVSIFTAILTFTSGLIMIPNIIIEIINKLPLLGVAVNLVALVLLYPLNTETEYACITFIFYALAEIFGMFYPYFIPFEYLSVTNTCTSIVINLLELVYMYLLMLGIINYLYRLGEHRNVRLCKRNFHIFTTSLTVGFVFSLIGTLLGNAAPIFEIIGLLGTGVCRIVSYVVFYIFLIIASRREN